MVGDLADTTQRRQRKIGVHAKAITSVGDPVEAGHAVHFVLGIATDEHVIAAFTDEFVKATAPEEYVVAADVVFQARIKVVAGRAVLGAHFNPVVAVAAHLLFIDFGAEDEVVTLTHENLGNVLGGDDEIV